MSVRDPDPFVSWSQSRSSAGSFESVQRLRLPAPVVEHSAAGAKRLGEVYWNEIERSMHGVVRARESLRGSGAPGAGHRACIAPVRPARASGHAGVGDVSPSDPRWAAGPGVGRLDLVHPDGRRRCRAQLGDRRVLPPPCAPPPATTVERRALPPAPDAASRRAGPALLRAAPGGGCPVRIAVLGATGTVGRALLPLLADEHDLVAVSRRAPSDERASTGRPPTRRTGRPCGGSWRESTSSTTSSIRSALPTSRSVTVSGPRPRHGKRNGRGFGS